MKNDDRGRKANEPWNTRPPEGKCFGDSRRRFRARGTAPRPMNESRPSHSSGVIVERVSRKCSRLSGGATGVSSHTAQHADNWINEDTGEKRPNNPKLQCHGGISRNVPCDTAQIRNKMCRIRSTCVSNKFKLAMSESGCQTSFRHNP
jgi:hypothetical protein